MFAEFKANLTDLIKKHTADDVFNGEEALTDLNDQILKYNSKNQPKVETFKDKAREEVISELGIKNVTNESQLVAHINGLSSDETAQDLIKMTTDRDKYKTDYDLLEGKFSAVNGKLTAYDREKLLIGKGVSATDADYHLFQINKLVTEDLDFETATNEYAKTNPNAFTVQPVGTKTTGTPRFPQSGNTEVDPIEQALIDKGRIK